MNFIPTKRSQATGAQLPRGETGTEHGARSPPHHSQGAGPTTGHPGYGAWGIVSAPSNPGEAAWLRVFAVSFILSAADNGKERLVKPFPYHPLKRYRENEEKTCFWTQKILLQQQITHIHPIFS